MTTESTSSQSGRRQGHARRNRVFRFIAIYAAGAFAVIQAADIAIPALGFPEWLTRWLILASLVGFPAVVLWAWFSKHAPKAVVPESDAEPAPPPIQAGRVAVLPFTVSGDGGHAYLGEGLVDLLASKLCCARPLSAVDPHALISHIRQMGEGRAGPERGRDVARRFGAGLFVLGNVLEVGGRLHIDATVYRTADDLPTVSRGSVQGGADDLFEMLDDLAIELLTDISRAMGTETTARLVSLAAVTTDSLVALRSYLEGESEMRAMRRVPAVEAFRRAVRADPSFSLAWYRLGIAALWSGDLELARDAAEHARDTSERLALHDRALVQAFYAFMHGEGQEAERLYRSIVGERPNDVEAWYQLGEVLFHYRPRLGGSVSESRPAWERVLELEPEHVSALVHLSFIAACERGVEEVRSLVDRALAISPDGDAASWMLALRASILDDREEWEKAADRIRRGSDFSVARVAWYVSIGSHHHDAAFYFTRLLTEDVRSPEARSLGHAWLAHLELARGRWSDALAELDAMAALDPGLAAAYRTLFHLSPAAPTSVGDDDLRRLRGQLAGARARKRPSAPATGAYFTVHDSLFEQIRCYLLGQLAARLGDRDEALSHVKSLEAVDGRPEVVELAGDQAAGIRARLVAADDPAAAFDILEGAGMTAMFELTMASPFYSLALERYQQAELLGRMGRTGEALRWFDSFKEHSVFDLIYLAPSHLARGRLLAESGDSGRAAAHFERTADIWREADDVALASLEEARRQVNGMAESAAS